MAQGYRNYEKPPLLLAARNNTDAAYQAGTPVTVERDRKDFTPQDALTDES